MPPKKKGKAKKKSANGELSAEDKLKKTMYEMDALRDGLAFRKEFARRSKSAFEDMKSKMDDTTAQIDDMESSHKASNAFLTNQYKSLQTEMGIKIHTLETELNVYKKNIEDSESEMKKLAQEKQKVIEEKDEKIADLERKLQNMELGYDNILNSCFDNIISQLETERKSWQKVSMDIQEKHKKLLDELGLKLDY